MNQMNNTEALKKIIDNLINGIYDGKFTLARETILEDIKKTLAENKKNCNDAEVNRIYKDITTKVKDGVVDKALNGLLGEEHIELVGNAAAIYDAIEKTAQILIDLSLQELAKSYPPHCD